MRMISPNEQTPLHNPPRRLLRLLLGDRGEEARYRFLCDAGFSLDHANEMGHLLVVVDSNFRFVGGGEREPSLLASRFFWPNALGMLSLDCGSGFELQDFEAEFLIVECKRSLGSVVDCLSTRSVRHHYCRL